MYLDSVKLLHMQVGYGELGTSGSLGYEDLRARVQGRHYDHALSTHPPARLRFNLDGRFASLRASVAINDDVRAGRSHAHFFVRADGVEVACVPYVVAGEPPRDLRANIVGARILELIVETDAWDFCHALWLDPEVSAEPVDVRVRTLNDCLNRAQIDLLPPQTETDCCIATVASDGFSPLLNNMLGSLQRHGNCGDARLVVFGVEPSKECQRIAERYGAQFISCQRHGPMNATVKSILYTAARVVPAQKFICLDADMLVLGDLQPIFKCIDVEPTGRVFAVREANGPRSRLDRAINTIYGGLPSDLNRLLLSPNGEGAYSLVVNDGTFAAGRMALLTLDGLIRSWKQAPRWVDERRDVWWRNQFIFNLALAHLDCGVELDASYNVQLNSQNVQLQDRNGQVKAFWQNRPVRVLHFNGRGRHKYPELNGRFAQAKNGA
jgi:hypothetical protein